MRKEDWLRLLGLYQKPLAAVELDIHRTNLSYHISNFQNTLIYIYRHNEIICLLYNTCDLTYIHTYAHTHT